MAMRRVLLLVTLMVAGAAVGAAATPAGAATTWLCRPGQTPNPCEGDLTATVVGPDGSQNVRADDRQPGSGHQRAAGGQP